MCYCAIASANTYVQFGAGTNTCLRKNISILEMGKFFLQVQRHFDLEWASSAPEWKTEAVGFWKQSGVVVRIKQ
jgi:cytochrome P450